MEELQNSPFGIHLQWFAENDNQGQAADSPVADGQAGTEPEPFWSVTVPGEKGDEVLRFATEDDIAKAFRESYMRRSDYSKKTAETSELRKAADSDKQLYAQMLADLNKRKAELEEKEKKYTGYEKQLQMNPALRRELEKLKGQPHSGEDIQEMIEQIVESKYGSTIEEINNWKRENQLTEEKKKAYEACRQEFEDFDPNAVDSYYQELANGDINSLVKALYYAQKGKSIDPVKMQQQLVDNIQKKQDAKLPSTEGSQASGTKKKVPGSIDEALQALHIED
jgi:hypothetical protein